jgi:hypothetical protein
LFALLLLQSWPGNVQRVQSEAPQMTLPLSIKFLLGVGVLGGINLVLLGVQIIWQLERWGSALFALAAACVTVGMITVALFLLLGYVVSEVRKRS